MSTQQSVIDTLETLARSLTTENTALVAAMERTYLSNNWLTAENYEKAMAEWKHQLSAENLKAFCKPYVFQKTPKQVGIIMAGNIPMVGFHDLMCTLLSGHNAVIKPSSDDKFVITYLCEEIIKINPNISIEIVERMPTIDAVIATGSNNTFRYFEHYFKNIPHLLRKNRKSLAILSGEETDEDLSLLADDVFTYFGLGCRNVSLLLLPKSMEIEKVLDHFMPYAHLANNHKYANNYTYHKALLLMNSEKHLDTGFALPKEAMSLNAPLSCIHYWYYDDYQDVLGFLAKNEDEIQCIVGNYCPDANVPFGDSQKPELQDFADGIDTMHLLENL